MSQVNITKFEELKFLIKEVFQALAFRILQYKSIHLAELCRTTFIREGREVKYMLTSSKPVYIYVSNNTLWYFKECPRHTSFKEYMINAISEFNRIITADNLYGSEGCQPFIHVGCEDIKIFTETINSIANKFSVVRFRRLGRQLNIHAFSYKNCDQELVRRILGIINVDINYIHSKNNIWIIFLFYLRNVYRSYSEHLFIGRGNYEVIQGEKSIATVKMAKLMGLGTLVADSQYTQLIIDGRIYYGVSTIKAEGRCALNADCSISPQLQKAYSDMQLLDAICWQTDHWLSNYNICQNEFGEWDSLCAFDNDCIFAFFPRSKPYFISAGHGAPIILRNNRMNIRHFSEGTVNNLFNLNYNQIRSELSHELNWLQLDALVKRIKRLINIFQKSYTKGELILHNDNQWNEDSLKDLLSGKYGNTLLFQYYCHMNNIIFDKPNYKEKLAMCGYINYDFDPIRNGIAASNNNSTVNLI